MISKYRIRANRMTCLIRTPLVGFGANYGQFQRKFILKFCNIWIIFGQTLPLCTTKKPQILIQRRCSICMDTVSAHMVPIHNGCVNTLSPPNSRILGPRKWPQIWKSRIWSPFYIVKVEFGANIFSKLPILETLGIFQNYCNCLS